MGSLRKMASIQRIVDVSPIDGADRLESVTVEAWRCVVGKGRFHVGDDVVYFEVDTFMPLSNDAFSFLSTGTKDMMVGGKVVKGHVIRTMKLRGSLSQGLVMHQEELGLDPSSHSVGDDVTSEIGVCEYEPIDIAQGTMGGFDSSVAPITDAMRLQSCPEAWDVLRKVRTRASVKVDGTSSTFVHDPRTDTFRVFGHKHELDQSQGMGNEMLRCAESQGIKDFCDRNPGITVQCEFVGPKVNSNRLCLDSHRLFVFAVWNMLDGRAKVPFDDGGVCGPGYDVLRESQCPVLDVRLSDFDTIDDAMEWASTLRGNVTEGRLDEGCVFHIMGRGDVPEHDWEATRKWLTDVIGDPLEVKALNNRYLLRERC